MHGKNLAGCCSKDALIPRVPLMFILTSVAFCSRPLAKMRAPAGLIRLPGHDARMPNHASVIYLFIYFLQISEANMYHSHVPLIFNFTRALFFPKDVANADIPLSPMLFPEGAWIHKS